MNQNEQAQPAPQPTIADLERRAQQHFGPHPFSQERRRARLDAVLTGVMALSQAFPYLQAASAKEAIFDAIATNRDLPRDVLLTSAVGAFLYWDELGGHNLALRHGNVGLPRLLEVERRHHAELFRHDASRVLGRPVTPDYTPHTRAYLMALHEGLSSPDPVRRCAFMVAFELHAGDFIESLWEWVAEASAIPREELQYFSAHVGGDDPAELYHAQMTHRLIEAIVPHSDNARFSALFLEAYGLNHNWCRTLIEQETSNSAAEREAAPRAWRSGSCHCKGVRFEVRTGTQLIAHRCNCSVCSMTGFLHLAVSAEDLRVISGSELLSDYRFNTRVARHTFCSVCGVKPFYRPRSDPDGFSVDARCLDPLPEQSLLIRDFDGANWEAAIAAYPGAARADRAEPMSSER